MYPSARVGLWLLLSWGAAAACSRTPTPPPPPTPHDGTLERCAAPSVAVARDVRLEGAHDPAARVPAAALRQALEQACELLGLRCAVSLQARRIGTPLAVAAADLPTDDAALRAAVEERIAACARAAFPDDRPANADAASAAPVIGVVVLPVLAPADAALSAVLPELDGLGLPTEHPALGGLPARLRRPLVLLDGARLAEASATRRAALLGHELGHALGLPHAAPDRVAALMGAPGPCAGGLDASEAALVRARLDPPEAP